MILIIITITPLRSCGLLEVHPEPQAADRLGRQRLAEVSQLLDVINTIL